MRFSLPYGDSMAEMEVEDTCFIGLMDPPCQPPNPDPEGEIRYAI